jgi:hypothetical protein
VGGDLPATDLHLAGTSLGIRRAKPKMVVARAINVNLETLRLGQSSHASKVYREVYQRVYRATRPT